MKKNVYFIIVLICVLGFYAFKTAHNLLLSDVDKLKKENRELGQKVQTYELKNIKNEYYRKKTDNEDQGYVGISFGTGGAADGPSTSLEIGRIKKQEKIIGLGVAWIGTNDLAKTYYLNAPSPSGSTSQGFYNEGDEYELFGVYGKKYKKNIFLVGTLGVSQQKKVDLEKAPVTGALYAKNSKKEYNIAFSGQLRHMLNNGNMLNIGYHNRRGFIAGFNIKW